MKALINKLAGIAYRRVFKREMSATEGDFVQSLSWVGAGTFIAAALTAVFSILGGRLLGPEEYGRYTLIQSIAMILWIPMLAEFNTAMLKHTAEDSGGTRQKSIISTAHIITIGLTVNVAGLMMLFSEPLSGVFATTPGEFRFSVYFAVLFALFGLGQATLRGIGRMRAFAISQPVYAGILLVAFASFRFLGRLSYEAMVYSRVIAYAVTGLGVLILHTRRYLTPSPNWAWARRLSRFAAAHIIVVVAVAVYAQIGKIVVAHYLTVADVGIYGAYLTATVSLSAVLWLALNTVFFPTASRYRDKRPLLRRLNRLTPLTIGFGIPLVMGSGYVILLLFGGEYPFRLLWLALLAVAATLSVTAGLYGSLFASQGSRGAFIVSIAAVTNALVNLGLSVLLVPVIGISGAMVAAIAAHVIGIIVLLVTGRRYLTGDQPAGHHLTKEP